jgi:hypothetical protein
VVSTSTVYSVGSASNTGLEIIYSDLGFSWAQDEKFCRSRNQALAFATIREWLFPLPRCCGIGGLQMLL